MSLPTSHMAYTKEYELYDRALDAPKGTRVRVSSYVQAMTLRSRLHYARRLARNKNAELYEKGHSLYGSSIYDSIKCSIKQDEDQKYWVYLEKSGSDIEVIEDLGEEPEAPKEVEAIVDDFAEDSK